LSAQWFSQPTFYGHATYTYLPASEILSRVRVGILGDIGEVATQSQTLTPMGGMPMPVSGTGFNPKLYSQIGAELALTFGPLAAPLTLTSVYLHGTEDQALIPNATRDAQFHGGFFQLDYSPWLTMTFFVRYDWVKNLTQADPTVPSDANDQDAVSGGIRGAIWLSAWGSLVAHLEASTMNVQNAAAIPTNPVRTTAVFTGLDFAL
jgi:hypothetical protein